MNFLFKINSNRTFSDDSLVQWGCVQTSDAFFISLSNVDSITIGVVHKSIVGVYCQSSLNSVRFPLVEKTFPLKNITDIREQW